MLSSKIDIHLPKWLEQQLQGFAKPCRSVEKQMELVLRVAKLNVVNHSGGPFCAAIFTLENGQPVSVGVNIVVNTDLSVAHAEIIAISLTQNYVNNFDLGNPNMPPLQLVTSAGPCSICLGAIYWAGLQLIVIAAREEDVASIGFDEGQKPDDRLGSFKSRGISVQRDFKRSDAVRMLEQYREQGGVIYNSPYTTSESL